MRDNPLREFRERRLGWSRTKLAQRIGRSEPLIVLYETEVNDELLRQLASIAAEEGHPDYAQIFLGLVDSPDTGQPETASQINPHLPNTPEEELLVQYLLEIVRDPDPDSLVQAGVPQFLRQIHEHRREFYKRK